MQQTAIHNERHGDRAIQHGEAVQQKQAGVGRRGTDAIEGGEERDQPEQGVGGLERELSRAEQQREQRDVAGDGERAEGREPAAVAQAQ